MYGAHYQIVLRLFDERDVPFPVHMNNDGHTSELDAISLLN